MGRTERYSLVSAIVSIVAVFALALLVWNVTAREHDFVVEQFASLDSRISNSGERLADIKKVLSVEKTANDLERLNVELAKANETLTQLQKQLSLDSVKTAVARLDTKLGETEKMLADIKKSTAPDSLTSALAPLDSRLSATEKTLADIKTSIASDGLKASLAPLDAKIDKANAALAGIVSKPDDATRNQALTQVEEAIKSLKTEMAGTAPLNAKLTDAVASLDKIQKTLPVLETAAKESAARDAKLQAELLQAITKSDRPGYSEPAKAAADGKPTADLIVLHVPRPDSPRPPKPGDIPPMTVRFDKIGGLDDKGQTARIAAEIREAVKGRTGCSIGVAGHADTLGGDAVNHRISKKRAREIAAKLKTAFADTDIQISETAWGERRLQEWTPNNVADVANRRVDISIDCKDR